MSTSPPERTDGADARPDTAHVVLVTTTPELAGAFFHDLTEAVRWHGGNLRHYICGPAPDLLDEVHQAGRQLLRHTRTLQVSDPEPGAGPEGRTSDPAPGSGVRQVQGRFVPGPAPTGPDLAEDRVQNLLTHLLAYLRDKLSPGLRERLDQELDPADLAVVALTVDDAYMRQEPGLAGALAWARSQRGVPYVLSGRHHPPPAPPATAADEHADVEEAARLLASASGSPRYTDDGYGWQALLRYEPTPEANVADAARLALKAHAPGDPAADPIRRAAGLLAQHALTHCPVCTAPQEGGHQP